MQILLSIISIALLQISCASLRFWEDSPEEVTAEQKAQVEEKAKVEAASDETDLKIAKLWSRVDELEAVVAKQKQRIGILERGLMLGILPDELKSDAERKTEAPVTKKVEVAPEHHAEKVTEVLPEAEVIEKPVAVAVPKSDRNTTLTEAQKFFEQGQYGRALALYSAMDDENDGTHRYWMGMCWMKLKEYETAHKEFTEFLAKYPTGVWVPRAKYNLAQIDYQLGYREKALSQMRKIIEEYPNEDAAQMARSSLQQMELNL